MERTGGKIIWKETGRKTEIDRTRVIGETEFKSIDVHSI